MEEQHIYSPNVNSWRIKLKTPQNSWSTVGDNSSRHTVRRSAGRPCAPGSRPVSEASTQGSHGQVWRVEMDVGVENVRPAPRHGCSPGSAD